MIWDRGGNIVLSWTLHIRMTWSQTAKENTRIVVFCLNSVQNILQNKTQNWQSIGMEFIMKSTNCQDHAIWFWLGIGIMHLSIWPNVMLFGIISSYLVRNMAAILDWKSKLIIHLPLTFVQNPCIKYNTAANQVKSDQENSFSCEHISSFY